MRNTRTGRTKHESTQSNRTPSLGEFVEVTSGFEDAGKRLTVILLDGRPNGYRQVFKTGLGSEIRDFDVLRSDYLKNKVASCKGAYIQLKATRGLEGHFRVEGVESPATHRETSRKPNVNVAGNGQRACKFASRRSGVKRLVTSHAVDNHSRLKGE